ncbi:MAG: hypothetical protein ACKO2D_00455 [Chloroflexota bacterium]|jgi:hypothetical protein|nr:hypothetical protein [Chloroflexota bacterium]NCA12861.1 hypothetical protein [Pseudomonadota bacterium]
MIQYQATRITNAQATAVAEAIACLMAVDISLRDVVEAEEVDPDSVTAAIVRLVLAFSHTHGDLEAMFGGAHGLRAIAEEKRLQLVASDRPN